MEVTFSSGMTKNKMKLGSLKKQSFNNSTRCSSVHYIQEPRVSVQDTRLHELGDTGPNCIYLLLVCFKVTQQQTVSFMVHHCAGVFTGEELPLAGFDGT